MSRSKTVCSAIFLLLSLYFITSSGSEKTNLLAYGPDLEVTWFAFRHALHTACADGKTPRTELTRTGFFQRRLSYNSSSLASFNPEILRIVRSGHVHPHPGPATRVKCPTCTRTIARNHRNTVCSACNSSFHIKCSGLSVLIYRQILAGLINDWKFSNCSNSIQAVFDFSDSLFEENISFQDGDYANQCHLTQNLHTTRVSTDAEIQRSETASVTQTYDGNLRIQI